MSFYKIPQNYAPGFVPQRYTFINDAAAATLTARLTDTRTAESVAELALRDLWMPEIDVSAFLRRMAATVPFETGATGLYAPTTRTMTLSLAIGSDKAPDRIFLPATRETRSGEPLTSLPEVRLIGAEETGRGIGTLPHAMLGPPHGDLQRHPDAAHVRRRGRGRRPLPARSGGVPRRGGVRPAPDGRRRRSRISATRWPKRPQGARRLAWLNEAGGIDRYTFPLIEERRYEIERRRLLLEESGYTQTEAVGEERLRIGSAYEPAAVLDALARLAAAPAVWAVTEAGWTEVDVVSDSLRIERPGTLQRLSLEIRPRQRGGRL